MELKESQQGARVSHGTFKNTTGGTGSKKVTKNDLTGADFGEPFFCFSKSTKNHPQQNQQKQWILMPKACQHGEKIDAQTHQKSVPK